MKIVFTTVVLLIFFGSCKESGVQLAKASTFVRYISDGNPNTAVDVLQTSDNGFLIVSNAQPTSTPGFINLVKTDIFGNQVLKQIIPAPSSGNLSCSNIVAFNGSSGDGGYLLVGTLKDASASGSGSGLYVAVLNTDLTVAKSKTLYLKNGQPSDYASGKGAYLIGKGIAAYDSARNDFFVVASVVGADLVTPYINNGTESKDMFFARFTNGTTLDTAYARIYGAGTAGLVSRIYVDQPTKNYVFWGGTKTDDNGVHMRLVEASSGIQHGVPSQNTLYDATFPLGDLTNFLTGGDFCPLGYDYFTFVGSHNSPTQANAYDSIVYFQAGKADGKVIGSIHNFPLHFTQSAQPGNSICATLDGGVLLLGTISQDATLGTTANTDYYLIKLAVDGTKQWAVTHGGKYPDVGVRVLQSRDGGYVVLGTTELANVSTVLLMKTDAQGNIQ